MNPATNFKDDALVGQLLGPYRISSALGRGGMGSVYRGEHHQTAQAVALKIVSRVQEGLLSGLRREIHALSRLKHPGIVSILEHGVHEGLPWYAMELVDGVTLRRHAMAGASEAWLDEKPTEQPWWTDALTNSHAQRAASSKLAVQSGRENQRRPPQTKDEQRGRRQGRQQRLQRAPSQEPAPAPAVESAGARVPIAASGLPVREVLTLVRRLCAPLAYLHGEGVVHRDLKPDNILIRAASAEQRAASEVPEDSAALAVPDSQFGDPGWPVIVDFGLTAPLAGGMSREALDLDFHGAGTAAYMAPEQIRGEMVDARADLYALGCVLYELLTGCKPFEGRTLGEMLSAHLHEAPVPPSVRAAVVGVRRDAARLDALVLRLLEKEPRRRLGHADDVAAALAELGAQDGLAAAGPRPRAYLYRPGFGGRDEPMRELSAALDGLEQGLGGLVLVSGESGVGKTRLLLELAKEARERGAQVLAGECIPTVPFSGLESVRVARGRSRRSPSQAAAGGPLHGLRRPLQAVADRCRSLGLAGTERLLGRRGKVLALYEPALASLPGLEHYPEPAELPADAARLRVFSYLAESFSALAEDGPLALLLDDLQWADDLTLGFLQYWQRALAVGAHERVDLLVVGAYRSEEVDTGLTEVGTMHATALRRLIDGAGRAPVALGRLEEAAVGSMVGDMLALVPPPVLFARHLTRHSEGNPFFVAEYLRAAVTAGLLWRDGQGVWQVAEPAGAHRDASSAAATEATYEALPLPGTLRELVARRLDGLDRAARKLVDAAAVLGREAALELLGPMLRLGERTLYDALNELLRRQVLEVPTPGRLRFVHDKIREVAYAGLRKERRKKLHRAAAESIAGAQAGAPAQANEQLAALGHHWEQAGEPARARPCYLAAARQATARYDHTEAERLYRAYLRLVEGSTVESVTARNELGENVLSVCGRNEEALCEHGRALEESRLVGDRQNEAKALRQQGRTMQLTGRQEQTRQLYEQALGISREVGDRQCEATVLQSLGSLAMDQGRLEEARQLDEQALAIYREMGYRRGEGMILGNLGVLDMKQGRPEKARQLSKQALAIYREVGDRRREGHVLGILAGLCLERGLLEEARQLSEQALAIHREVGYRNGEAEVLGNLGIVDEQQGRPEEARQLYEQAVVIHCEVGDRHGQGRVLGNLGNLHTEQGRPEKARQLYEQALAIHREVGNRRDEGIGLFNLGDLDMTQGRLEGARRLYEQALAIHCEVGNRRAEGYVLVYLGIVHMEQGRPEKARQLYEQSLGIHREVGGRLGVGFTLHVLACLARLATGDLATATHLAEQAEESLTEVGARLVLGTLLCNRGHIELAGGRSGRGLLDRAQALAEASGAGPGSSLGKPISKLRRTCAAFEAGEHHRLFRGEIVDDIPEGLRRWLRDTGQLPADYSPANEIT